MYVSNYINFCKPNLATWYTLNLSLGCVIQDHQIYIYITGFGLKVLFNMLHIKHSFKVCNIWSLNIFQYLTGLGLKIVLSMLHIKPSFRVCNTELSYICKYFTYLGLKQSIFYNKPRCNYLHAHAKLKKHDKIILEISRSVYKINNIVCWCLITRYKEKWCLNDSFNIYPFTYMQHS